MDRHEERVLSIASQVRGFYSRQQGFRIFHGSTNSTRPQPHQRDCMIDTSGLSNVMSVDTRTKTALVEPNVPMDRLVDTTVKYKLIPPVVMEFPGITVGGGFAGTSGESSSFKYGFFNCTINYVEMVLANGEIVKASRTERPDLFHGASGVAGTLGVVTLLEIQLIDMKKFVETTYHPVGSVSEALTTLDKLSKDPSVDYLDGILFSTTSGAIIAGRLTDIIKSNINIQTFSGPWDPWYYLHVRKLLSFTSDASHPIVEAVPIEDYLFRYDRGGFWVGQAVFDYFKFPFNQYTRWFFDDILRPRLMYRGLHHSGESNRFVVQDIAFPYDSAEEFIHYSDETLGIYPLWLCPLKQSKAPTMHPHFEETDENGALKQMVSIGLWGYAPRNMPFDTWVSLNRNLESKLVELRGMKWLYAHTFYTKDEFWQVYDLKWYENLRVKYAATYLPSVYDKVRVNIEKEREVDRTWKSWILKTRPFGAVYGITRAIQSGDTALAKRKLWKSIEAKSDQFGNP